MKNNYEGILVTVNLQGEIEGCVQHRSFQKHTITTIKDETISKVIAHTDRKPSPCYKIIRITEDVVNQWVNGEPIEGIDVRKWKAISDINKIRLYVSFLDEGFGVSFSFIK